ncbi:MAG: hypothetical protein QT00_C0002G0478 [archaeon GW2011_AR5]|nr:MAG: hypothetical protein QT00_C0002G0478 [archaeon GW2011_AR5]
MIHLKMTRSDRNYVKKSGARAFYDPKTDRIVLLGSREDEAAGVVSHELMHRMFCRAGQFKASKCWDKNIIIMLEGRLGWRPSIMSFWIERLKTLLNK